MLYLKEMDEIYAEKILSWKYEAPYDFYNNEYSVEAVWEMLNSSYTAILNNQDEVFGFFCIGDSAQVPIGAESGTYPHGYVDVGIGMNPEFTGRGEGLSFFKFILQQIYQVHGVMPVRLTVAAFNTRAIHLYEKLGFVKEKEFCHGDNVFITMVREVSKINKET